MSTTATTIRVAQFSDLHYGTRTLAEADRCFGAAIDSAMALGVQAAVISGDATDHALDLHAPAAMRLAAQIRRLADHCPVLMLQGTYSHEPPGTLAVFRLLGGRYPVHVADRIGQVALTGHGGWVESTGWRFDTVPVGACALFSCVPTVNKAAVAAAVGAAEAGQAVGEHLADLLRGYAAIHRAARAQGLPTIGVSHGTVFGCISEHGVPMAGFDHEFTTGALFGAEAQAFMLGHIHRHQSWVVNGMVGRQCTAYPGAIGRFHHGEEGEKGFLVWEVGPEGASCTLQPTPARRMLDIVFEGKPDLAALRLAVEQHDIAGAFVRVRWVVADEDRHEVDRATIQGLLSGAAQVQLEGRIVPLARSRAPGISQLATLADKVRAWAAATGVNPTPLIACLEQSVTTLPQDIVAQALDGGAVEPADEDVDAIGSEPRLDHQPNGELPCDPSH